MSAFQKLYAVINLLVGTIACSGGILLFIIMMANSTNNRSMAFAVIATLAFLGLLTLPMLFHGFLFFKFPIPFGKYNHFFALFLMVEVAAIYLMTEGFHDIGYHNKPYEFQEFMAFLAIVSYFASHLAVYPNPLKTLIKGFLSRS